MPDESKGKHPKSFRFDDRAVARLDELQKSLKLASHTEVIQVALKSLTVLAEMADAKNRVDLQSTDKQVTLFLD